MFNISKKAVVVDFMSSYVDEKHEHSFHPTINELTDWAIGLSRKFAIYHDYMPFEQMLCIYKQDQYNNQSLFKD